VVQVSRTWYTTWIVIEISTKASFIQDTPYFHIWLSLVVVALATWVDPESTTVTTTLGVPQLDLLLLVRNGGAAAAAVASKGSWNDAAWKGMTTTTTTDVRALLQQHSCGLW
jgi:hypothetical protein